MTNPCLSRNLPASLGFPGKSVLLAVMLVNLGLMLANNVTAQTFTNLHNFKVSNGSIPFGNLILSGNKFYGAVAYGGASGNGGIFAINTDGAGYANLHSFTATSDPNATNSDGGNPCAGLILSGSTLYGTTAQGGTGGFGAIFRVNTDGTLFTNLHSFAAISTNSAGVYTNKDGAYPRAGLTLSSNVLYGTASQGGVSGSGTLFKLGTDGTSFTNLHIFTATSGPQNTNSDGATPWAGLTLSGSTLYGTTSQGGNGEKNFDWGVGTIFKINIDGTGFTNLHSFTATSGPLSTNSDGATPKGTLILSGSTLYGTTAQGGSYGDIYTGSGNGIIFKISTDGTGFTNLHNFTTTGVNGDGYVTNSDGETPNAGLLLVGHALYGTANVGGNGGTGTIFTLNTNGTGFASLHSFHDYSYPYYTNIDGAFPYAGLILSSNVLFGTTGGCGTSGGGTLFSLTLPQPRLAMVRSGTNMVLTWPTNLIAWELESTADLVPTALWSTVSPVSVVVSGQNTVTNSIPGTRMFYRLSQ